MNVVLRKLFIYLVMLIKLAIAEIFKLSFLKTKESYNIRVSYVN